MRSDLFLVDTRLLGVRSKHHDHIGPLRYLGHTADLKAGLLGLRFRGAALAKSHANVYAAIHKVQSMGMALRTIADDANLLAANDREICRRIVINLCHKSFLN